MAITTDLNKATPTSFEMIFPMLPGQTGLAANDELILNISGAILPAISINPVEVNWQGALHKVAGAPMDYEIVNVMFNVDSHFKNWKLLWNWMSFINNGKDKMAEKYSQYAVDTSLKIMDNFGGDVMAVNYKGMWPTNLQEVSFSYKEGEVLLESSVTFVFDYFIIVDNI